MNLSTTIIYGPLTLEINYDFSPAEPDVFYLRNGDPGYPGSDAELAIRTITSLQAPGIDFIKVLESLDAEHDLSLMSMVENICLSDGELTGSNALAREESALDSFYESLRDR